NGGTGGAGSALFVGGNLVVVAGGGGGCYSAYEWHLQGDKRYQDYRSDYVNISRGGSITGLPGSDGWGISIKQNLEPGNEIATMLTFGGGKAGTTSGPGAAGDYVSGTYLGFAAGQPGNGRDGGDGGTANCTGPAGGGGGGGGGYFGGGGGASGWHQNTTAYGAQSTVYTGEIAGSPGGGGASYAAPGLSVSETWQTETAPGSVILTFF
ncbi:hypothetical protein FBULB1_5628, partial [Fusarium bulbicola]